MINKGTLFTQNLTERILPNNVIQLKKLPILLTVITTMKQNL